MSDDTSEPDDEFDSGESDGQYWFRRPVLRGIATASGMGLVGSLSTQSVRAVQTGQQTTDFMWSPDSPAAGESVTFTSTATDPDGDITLYSWDFDADGAQDATGQEVTHTFETAGRYDVRHAVLYGSDRIETVTKTLTVGSSGWRQVAKLLASDGERGDLFGRAVGISGDTALVGAFNRYGGTTPGSAYVFVRNGGTWTEQAKLTASAGAPKTDRFAETLSLDGDTAVIGARGDDDTGPNAGAAYVFVREGTTWRQQTKLTHTPEGDDRFANAVSVSGDTVLVGAFRNNTEMSGNAGAVYVFTRPEETWSQQAKLYAGDGHSSQWFGRAVSIDGDTAIIGASGDGAMAEAAGAAYVYTRSGGTWSEQAKLVANDAEEGNQFGWSVDVDGDTAIVGVRGKDDKDVKWLGAAYVFARSGSSWSQQAKLSPDDLEEGTEWGELFGKAGVSIDGDTAVVAAAGSTGSHTGKVYVYNRSGTTWTNEAILVEEDPLPYPTINKSEFGNSVAIDENSVIVGAQGHDETAPGAGAAFVYEP